MPTATNGPVSLAYEVHEPAPSAAPLGTLLLVPGLGGTLALWEPAFLSRLAELGFRVVVMDPRGAGASSHPDGAWTLADMAGDCVAVLDAAGTEKAAVLGHSMGGIIAQKLASSHPSRVSSLVVLGAAAGAKHAKPAPSLLGYFLALQACAAVLPWTSWASEYAASWVRYAERRTMEGMFAAVATSSKNRQASLSREMWDRQWERTGKHTTLSPGQLPAVDVDITADAAGIACPAAVVCGTEDCFYPVASIEALHGSIRGSELVLLEGYNHWYPTEVWVQVADIAARTAKRGHELPVYMYR